MGTPSSINGQVLRELCAKFDTFVRSVTIRPIFCTKRPDYYFPADCKEAAHCGRQGALGTKLNLKKKMAPGRRHG